MKARNCDTYIYRLEDKDYEPLQMDEELRAYKPYLVAIYDGVDVRVYAGFENYSTLEFQWGCIVSNTRKLHELVIRNLEAHNYDWQPLLDMIKEDSNESEE